ncbi:hypothetical protein N7478_001429 [Penicillium angulare]|uniref:uncharacterized protein n=1 Tax=Penicillium angulare TaxID=116970 RepID=UPI0025409F96|nr:uncharacterized protein N7478_000736 [Penicillium angulare]XP_056785524.1 uncharacterized protein N7478_001429 [Penicillium angulare]KAJ5291485.1 hypothetical protein N7478_000736 [Penicillium angulare]KAJ5292178.1 hypothetical protein N7478_001429 [Penicillium angulare]
MAQLKTMRIECENIDDIEMNGLGDIVRAAISLGYYQVEIAVEPEGVSRVCSVFKDLTSCRLLSTDPLFSRNIVIFVRANGKTYADDAYNALRHIWTRYLSAQNQPNMPSDPRLMKWFATELERIQELMRHFGKQINIHD